MGGCCAVLFNICRIIAHSFRTGVEENFQRKEYWRLQLIRVLRHFGFDELEIVYNFQGLPVLFKRGCGTNTFLITHAFLHKKTLSYSYRHVPFKHANWIKRILDWTDYCRRRAADQRFSRGHLARTRSRTRRGIPRNFGLFLCNFKDETLIPCFSRSRTRRGEEFCPIPRPFRGRDETLENLWNAICETRKTRHS